MRLKSVPYRSSTFLIYGKSVHVNVFKGLCVCRFNACLSFHLNTGKIQVKRIYPVLASRIVIYFYSVYVHVARARGIFKAQLRPFSGRDFADKRLLVRVTVCVIARLFITFPRLGQPDSRADVLHLVNIRVIIVTLTPADIFRVYICGDFYLISRRDFRFVKQIQRMYTGFNRGWSPISVQTVSPV